MNKLALKTLARSRSLRLARDVDALERGEWGGEAVHEVPWRTGDGRPVAYRPGSSDVGLVYAILFKPARKSEYWLPPEVAPRTIFDIGANIGITARYLAHRFPDAAIHAFEPIAANLELLRRNVAGCNVTVHPYGLGAADGAAEFGVPAGAPDNRGGYSRFAGAAATSVVRAEIRSVGGVLDALRLDSVDVVKIDTEGAEYDILSAFPAAALARALDLRRAPRRGGRRGLRFPGARPARALVRHRGAQAAAKAQFLLRRLQPAAGRARARVPAGPPMTGGHQE